MSTVFTLGLPLPRTRFTPTVRSAATWISNVHPQGMELRCSNAPCTGWDTLPTAVMPAGCDFSLSDLTAGLFRGVQRLTSKQLKQHPQEPGLDRPE